jgi:type IV fimbrial biogenesis protein FimT
MLTARRSQRGITIIETMIAITILVILLMIAMPQYSAWLQNGQIRTAAEGVMAGLQFARAEAVTRNVAGGVAFNIVGNGWTVTLVSDGSVLRSQSGTERTPNAQLAVNPVGAVTFDGLGRLLAPAGGAVFSLTNSTGACIADSGSMRCLNIRVAPTGAMRMCDPSVTDGTDPRKC